jgi:PKD repeat protein
MPRWSFTHMFTVFAAALALVGCPPVTPDPEPVANFSATPRSGNTGLRVTFTDLSSTVADGPVTSWQWNFGDGGRSTEPNPVHTYLAAGNFNVSLTVTSSGGSHTRTRTGYIRVESPQGSAQLDEEGGIASANGVSITVAAGALEGNVNFGITRVNREINFNVFETINRVGDTFTITHDNDRTDMSTTGDGAVEPVLLAIPYAEDVVPTGSRVPAKVHILAQLEDGIVVPILGEIRSGSVVASVTGLPATALYTVVYRPDGVLERVATSQPGKAATGTNWNDFWDVSLSPALLNQLTALRLGNILSPSSFGDLEFTEEQLDETLLALRDGLQATQGAFEGVLSRSPRLVTLSGAHTVTFFNMVELYPSAIGSIDSVFYAGSPFGSVVVDPRQLLAISTWNADRLGADPQNTDIAQVLGASQVIAEVVTRAVVDGYDYPEVTMASAADGGAVSFVAGITEGLALHVGQEIGGIGANRSQLDGDFALLSTPVFSPIDADMAGYAAASQDFFRFVLNHYQPEPALAYVAQGTGPVKGLLEEIRIALDSANLLNYDTASRLTAGAIDNAFFAHLDVPLGEAYLNYALDLAFEHGPSGVLRSSDEGRLPLVLDEERFAPEAIEDGAIVGATGGADVELSAILPLSTRIARLAVAPDSDTLTLTFNRDEWTADTRNQSITVVVYREGLPGTVLPSNGSTLVFEDYEADLGSANATFYIVVVNNSFSVTNGVSITAEATVAVPAD